MLLRSRVVERCNEIARRTLLHRAGRGRAGFGEAMGVGERHRDADRLAFVGLARGVGVAGDALHRSGRRPSRCR